MTQRKIGIVLSYGNLITKNLVMFLYTPLLLRILGQSEYGIYQMVNSVMTSLSLFSLGFGSSYIRFFTRSKLKDNKDQVEKLNGMYLLVFLFMGFLAILGGVILILNVNNLYENTLTPTELYTARYLMVLMIINIGLTFPNSVFDCNIMASEQFKFQYSRQLFQTVIAPVLTIPFLLLGFKSLAIVFVQTALTLLFLLLNARFAISKLKMRFQFKNLDVSLLKEISIFSFYIFLNQIVDQVNWNVPNFLLGIFAGAKSVAIFAVANQIKLIFMSMSTSFSSVFIPQINKIVSEENDNNKQLTNVMTKVGRFQAVILLYIFGGFILLGQYFVEIWAGKGYVESFYAAILMIVPLFVPLIQNVGIEIQRAKNMHKFRSILYTIFAGINVLITIVTIKMWGILGATLGTFITMIVCNGLIMNWYYEKKVLLNMSYFWKSILPLFIPFLISTLCLSFFKTFVAINSLFSFISYGILYTIFFACIYYFFSMNDTEKNLAHTFLKRRKK
ncbi:lipopolysaccharide biosynthesis protein [Enterococcus sp. CWB-B31]|uniref:lipopolysaccharide biosynthesis protein n=1 Tax=Enterococcus sp. CWB-B31 TaxID=2885159 RepID=UPI001E3C72C2|nr:oligosaccharide flippase family protein [Enterococcus sp. CWB-B31]MCB5954623.1 oligosaccharide flippase family protein [Enterococcus sp. CWB-B31]